MLRQAPPRWSQYRLDIESLWDVRQILISFSLKHTIINLILSTNTEYSPDSLSQYLQVWIARANGTLQRGGGGDVYSEHCWGCYPG